MIICPSAHGIFGPGVAAVRKPIMLVRKPRGQQWNIGSLALNNPLASGLIFSAYNFGIETLRPYDAVARRFGTRAGTTLSVGTSLGRAPLFASASSAWAQFPIDLSSTNRIAISGWLWWDTFANDNALAMELTANVNTNAGAFNINPNNSVSGVFCVFVNASVASDISLTGWNRPSAGQWHHVVININRANSNVPGVIVPNLWFDTSEKTVTGSQASTANVSGVFAGPTFLNLMSRNATSQFGSGRWLYLNIFRRNLNDGEVKALYSTPNILVSPQTQLLRIT